MKHRFLIFIFVAGFLQVTGISHAKNEYSGKSVENAVAQQATRKISGAVKDTQGESIIGVNITVKGTTVGTVTDIEGKFSLDVSPGSILNISFIGYLSVEVPVGNNTNLQIVLQEDTKLLDEVVVVGYGTMKKKDLTGAVSSVKLGDTPVGTISTISHALAGKAAGLRVTQNSAQVGGGSTFRIRGAASINAGNDPLIIIDGFPVSSSSNLGSGTRYDAGSMDNILESLNPNDVESIEVLKDASATAIYGSRAGHGVIIVTTKRGKQGKPKVTYSGNASTQSMKNDYKMLNASEYKGQRVHDDYEKWMKNNGQDVYSSYITPNPSPAPFVPRYSEQEIANAATTDWFNEVTRTGFQQSHNVSVSSGTSTTQYLASINYFSQEGVIKNNNMDRLTANVNLDHQLSQYVKTGLSLKISRNQYDNVPLGGNNWENSGIIASAVRFDPSVPVRDEKGEYSKFPDMGQIPNPVSLLEISDKTNKDRVLGSAYAQVEPVKGLTLKATLGFDRKDVKRKNYVPNTTLYGASVGGDAHVSQDDDLDYLLDLTATYTKEIGKHNLTALVGYSYQQFNNEGFGAGSYDFSTDGFLYNNLGAGAGSNPSVGSWASKSALGSYFGRVNYSFMSKYLLTATLRADGDSDFDPAKRWGYFPSASLGWRFSEEGFMEPLSEIVSNAKLRAGYGQTGNSNVGNRIFDTYGISSSWVFGNKGYIGVAATQLGNKQLTWETTTEYNIGLDLGFINNRINLSAEYYNRIISDLLVTGKRLPSYNEITTIAANIGKTQGQGFELTLNTVNITNKDVLWTTDFSFYTYKDRWKERDPQWKPAVYQSVNDPIRSIFTYRSDGLLQVGEKAPAWQPALLPGQIKLKNVSDEEGKPNILDQYDRVLIGSEDPAFTFGFNNTVRYKNIDLNIYLYGEVDRLRGASYYDSWTAGYTGNPINPSRQTLNSWAHDNQNTKVPSIIQSNYDAGDYYYKKTSFVRCRNIMLGYTLPVPKTILNSVRLYADVNNPFIITNWNGVDPETDGGDYAYPNVTSFSLGIDISF
ncbi:TonB-dependent receptor SusC [termite gut metagenome]|uniref:TonB-dependent receptor SusC n=1 Tax=termite gut metagenome TaxID=433724 RepID=A0A5J4RQK7_9ZZZZ